MHVSFRSARAMLSAKTLAVLLTLLIATFALATSGAPSQAMQALGPVAVATPVIVDGNIGAHTIEIDTNANLYPEATPNAGVLNAPADVDWVKDSVDNQGTGCLNGSIANCNEANITAASGGVGHWNGARIVDGIPGTEQDIFLTGGKENDVSTWNVGPGSVGSSKYDITQAYLANNHSAVFFGMERRGNNGTTAFDFEFNQAAPASIYTPTRTIGDRLFTFEMQGSGGSGSAVPHYFTWDGSAYVEQSPLPAGLISSINNTAIPAGPWGDVDSHGNWSLSNLDRFEFAEAVAPLSLFNLTGCGGALYVQVRTRSSATAGSDLKDTTKIFQYQFGGPVAAAAISTSCNQDFTYNGAGSADSQGGSNITYSWVFTVPTGVTLSGGGVSGSSPVYHATLSTGTVSVSGISGAGPALIQAQNTVTENGTTCTASSSPVSVNVYPALSATALLTAQCNNTFAFASTVSGGKAPYSYSWVFYDSANNQVGTSTAASGTFSASAAGSYHATLTVNDTADGAANGKGICPFVANSNTVAVYSPVGGTVALTPGCDKTFTYLASGSGGLAPYTYSWTIEKLVGGSWITAKTFTDGPSASSSGTLDVDTFNSGANGDGTYRARVTITDAQGLSCNIALTSNQIDVRHALTASAVKTSADGAALSVLLTGSSNYTNGQDGVSFQWQKLSGANWVNITGQTANTLTYSSFASDATATATTFTIGADSYTGQLLTVQLRLHVARTLNGTLCTADSPAVTVKKVTAVDP